MTIKKEKQKLYRKLIKYLLIMIAIAVLIFASGYLIMKPKIDRDFVEYNKLKSKLQSYIGDTIIIINDTFTVVNYSTYKKTVILNNGDVIDYQIVNQLKEKQSDTIK